MTTVSVVTMPTGNSASFVAKWPNLAQGDDGAPLGCAQYTDRSFQVAGTFGGASVVVEGTNDGSNWATLTDPQGNSLAFTSPKLEMVSEATLKIRPRIVGGDITTDLTVTALLKE